jgi:hypothetical protein
MYSESDESLLRQKMTEKNVDSGRARGTKVRARSVRNANKNTISISLDASIPTSLNISNVSKIETKKKVLTTRGKIK